MTDFVTSAVRCHQPEWYEWALLDYRQKVSVAHCGYLGPRARLPPTTEGEMSSICRARVWRRWPGHPAPWTRPRRNSFVPTGSAPADQVERHKQKSRGLVCRGEKLPAPGAAVPQGPV